MSDRSKHNTFTILGASNHSSEERQENDYYATDPKAMTLLLEQESFSEDIWECACGGGHLSKVLIDAGYNVRSTDLVYRGFGEPEPLDFLSIKSEFYNTYNCDIITNPPYKYATEFVEQAINLISQEHKVAMFLRLQFLEGRKRRILFDKFPPSRVYVCSGRIVCRKNGDFESPSHTKWGAMAHAWFVWDKSDKSTDTIIKWIN